MNFSGLIVEMGVIHWFVEDDGSSVFWLMGDEKKGQQMTPDEFFRWAQKKFTQKKNKNGLRKEK